MRNIQNSEDELDQCATLFFKIVYRANKEIEPTKPSIISGDFAKVVKGITKGNSRKSLAKT